MKQKARLALIIQNTQDISLAGQRTFYAQLRDRTITKVIPLPGRPIGIHVENEMDENVGLSSIKPPAPDGTEFEMVDGAPLYHFFVRLGPDLTQTPWALVVGAVWVYEVPDPTNECAEAT